MALKSSDLTDTESRLVVFQGLGKRREWYGVSFWGDENVLELESSDGCTTL